VILLITGFLGTSTNVVTGSASEALVSDPPTTAFTVKSAVVPGSCPDTANVARVVVPKRDLSL
jgi:hypothetical protein